MEHLLQRVGVCLAWRVLSELHKDDSGQDLIEYALVAVLIALAATAVMGFVAGVINNTFSTIGNKIRHGISS
jgi:pilus assembly protein Flp/PilA